MCSAHFDSWIKEQGTLSVGLIRLRCLSDVRFNLQSLKLDKKQNFGSSLSFHS